MPCSERMKTCSVSPEGMEDRKSTRLNSSHTVISYAVFCLKKEKDTQQVERDRRPREADQRGARDRAGARDDRPHGCRRRRGVDHRHWYRAHRRARAGVDDPAARVAARRAGVGSDRRRDQGVRVAPPPARDRRCAHRPARRARHGVGHGSVRPHPRARLRRGHRGRPARRGAQRRSGSRRLSRLGRPMNEATSHVTTDLALELCDVRAGYGSITVLRGFDLEVPYGSLVALLGPNGGGKTTALRVIAGQIEASAGDVLVAGRRVNGAAPDELARRGVCLIPEGKGIFPNLSVRENLWMATHSGVALKAIEEVAYARFPQLGQRRRQLAGTLSGGEQQMLAMARALSTNPALLLLDELSMGF